MAKPSDPESEPVVSRGHAGGRATFSGTNYQAGVIAYVYAHVLAQARMGWFGLTDSIPLAVSGETRGIGDDLAMEFLDVQHVVEVQAKRSLAGGQELAEIVTKLRTDASGLLGLVLGRGSTRRLWAELPADIDRLRLGRVDLLGSDLLELRKAFSDQELSRLFVVAADFDGPDDPEAKIAIQLLRSVLIDASQAEAAWAVLVADASELCSRGLRRTRRELADLLGLKGIHLRPPAPDEKWVRELDFIQVLVEGRQTIAADVALARMGRAIESAPVGPEIQYRWLRLSGSVALQRDRVEEAFRLGSRAVDIDPNGVDALRLAALTAMYLGQNERAGSLADKAMSLAPTDPKVWGMFVQVARGLGRSEPTPPASVTSDPHYLLVLSELATNEGDWDAVLSNTEAVLATGKRPPEALFFRANAFLATASSERTRAREAERLATELIDEQPPNHPLVPKAYVLRSAARRLIDKGAEASDDLDRARALDPSDENAIRLAASWHLSKGEDDIALQVLANRNVDEAPLLLGMRAEIKARQGDIEGSRMDIAHAVSRLGSTETAEATRLAIAEAAIESGELETAEQLVGGLAVDAGAGAWTLLMRGRIRIRSGSFETADELYRAAAAADPDHRIGFLCELGVQLVRAGRAGMAIAAFREAGAPSEMDDVPLRAYLQALLDEHELVQAKDLVEAIAAQGTPPTWAIGAAVNIALGQDDQEEALRQLESLLAAGETSPQVRIALAKSLIELDRVAEAQPHIDRLLLDERTSAIERMQGAELLDMSGEATRAVDEAFMAYRLAPQDPQIHRAFASVVLRARLPVTEPRVIAPGVAAELRSSEGKKSTLIVFSDGPADPLRGEILETEASERGLIGLGVGDSVPKRPGGSWQAEWTVESLLPAVVSVFRDVINNFEDRFPSAPFFVRSYRIGEGDGVGDFAPIIASLGDRRRHVDSVFQLHRAQVLPLGFVANQLGASIEDVISAARQPEAAPPVIAEWSDRAGQTESITTAAAAEGFVVTRSALSTLVDLDLLGEVKRYRLSAPKSLLEQLKRDRREAEELVSSGQSTLVPRPSGFGLDELPSESPALISRLERIQVEIDFVSNATSILVRPLAFVAASGSDEDRYREAIGHDSYDSVALAYDIGDPLLADDLGLRRLGIAGRPRVQSTSTIGLVVALASSGAIAPGKRNEALLELATRNFVYVPPLPEVLELAMHRAPVLSQGQVRAAFRILQTPHLGADAAAEIASSALRAYTLRPLKGLGLPRAVELVLDGLAGRWKPRVVSQLLRRHVERDLRYVPQALGEIIPAIEAFAKAA